MTKVVKIIHHFLLILLTGVALIGVNVTQLYCAGCNDIYLWVQVLPQENDSPGEDICGCGEKECCCGDCHEAQDNDNVRHDFYKVSDHFQTERGSMPVAVSFYLPDTLIADEVSGFVLLPVQEYIDLFPEGSPPLPLEYLCTYLC